MLKARSGNLFVVRFQDGERLPAALLDLGIRAGAILGGVGMLRDLVLAYWNGREYVRETVDEPVELLSLQGNLGERDGEIVLHAHVVAGKEGGAAVGGHLVEATVHNTAEVIIAELPGVVMERRPEPSGLVGLYPREAR
ncbi:PPC domain-containing DNA-binding protein [Candidatus Bipolaricaulota sp. J31]